MSQLRTRDVLGTLYFTREAKSFIFSEALSVHCPNTEFWQQVSEVATNVQIIAVKLADQRQSSLIRE